MKNAIDQYLGQQHLLYNIENIFWKYLYIIPFLIMCKSVFVSNILTINTFSQLNIYSAIVPDKMHYLDLGLFNYQVIYTREMLKDLYSQTAVDELNNHLAIIPRFPGLKIFKNGLENIKWFIADKFHNIMKVFLFIVEEIIVKYCKAMKLNIAQ